MNEASAFDSPRDTIHQSAGGPVECERRPHDHRQGLVAHLAGGTLDGLDHQARSPEAETLHNQWEFGRSMRTEKEDNTGLDRGADPVASSGRYTLTGGPYRCGQWASPDRGGDE